VKTTIYEQPNGTPALYLPPEQGADKRVLHGYRHNEEFRREVKMNALFYRRNPDAYFRSVGGFLAHAAPKAFRWHPVGEVPDSRYVEGVFDLARNFQAVLFVLTSGRPELFLAHVEDVPENLGLAFKGEKRAEIR
jgi:hypothetical protein